MAESSQLSEKEKLLITSDFSFSYSVFRHVKNRVCLGKDERKWVLWNHRSSCHGFLGIICLDDTLTLYHTIPTFNNPDKEVFENIVGREENPGQPALFPFPTMFSTPSKPNV